MARTYRALTFVVVLAFTAGAAAASPITWLLEGKVTSTSVPGISVNDPASMLLTFESSTPDLEPDPSCGLYVPAIQAASAAFGSQTYVWNGGSNGIEISTGAGAIPSCGIEPGNFAGDAYRVFGGSLAGLSIFEVVAFFEEGPVLSDDLPLVPPPVAFFDSGINVIGVGSYGLLARITSAHVVPEPGTLVLIGTGVVPVLSARRRRQSDGPRRSQPSLGMRRA
jgi:hypothetical protein